MKFIFKIFLFSLVLISISVLMTTYFVNIFFVNEEIMNLPELSEEKSPEKISPNNNKFKNKDFDMQILLERKESNNKKQIIVKEVDPEPVPFDLNKNLLNKEVISQDKKTINKVKSKKQEKNSHSNKSLKNDNSPKKNIIKKYRVQLGSFKNKNRAEQAIKDLNLNISDIFQNYKLELYTLRKDNYYIHRVWTSQMSKKQALDLCDSLKKLKINCILQIDKS